MLHPGSEIHVGEKSESDIWDMGKHPSITWFLKHLNNIFNLPSSPLQP
jgi:hypothetical protein